MKKLSVIIIPATERTFFYEVFMRYPPSEMVRVGSILYDKGEYSAMNTGGFVALKCGKSMKEAVRQLCLDSLIRAYSPELCRACKRAVDSFHKNEPGDAPRQMISHSATVYLEAVLSAVQGETLDLYFAERGDGDGILGPDKLDGRHK